MVLDQAAHKMTLVCKEIYVLKTIRCCRLTLLVEVISFGIDECINRIYFGISGHWTQFSLRLPHSSSSQLLMMGLHFSLWVILNESLEINSVNNPFNSSDIRGQIWFILREPSWMNHRQWIVSLHVPPPWAAGSSVCCLVACLKISWYVWGLNGKTTRHNWR